MWGIRFPSQGVGTRTSRNWGDMFCSGKAKGEIGVTCFTSEEQKMEKSKSGYLLYSQAVRAQVHFQVTFLTREELKMWKLKLR